MEKLPIYNALIDDKEDGLICVSIVDYPATEVDYMLFDKQQIKEKFAVQDEEKHLLSSVLMVADTPIYRRDANGYEYYIKYEKETLVKMAQKMLADGTYNTFDFNHSGERLESGKIQLVELYIKDEEKGLNPNFLDVPDGSLMATYKILDDDIWEALKTDKFNGLSLEGYFTVKEAEAFNAVSDKEETEILELISRLKDKIRNK